MNKLHTAFLAPMLMLILALLGACTVIDKRDAQTVYDLGPAASNDAGKVANTAASAATGKAAGTATGVTTASNTSSASRAPALVVADITAPSWMDSSRMVYRLEYDNPLEARTYASARWTMSPARLFLQRVKAGLAQSGMAVLSGGDGAVGLPQLRIEADDFSQVFESASQSRGRVAVRASVLQERRLVAQKTFSSSVPAPSADAGGGVSALASASDAVIADMVAWLNSINLPR